MTAFSELAGVFDRLAATSSSTAMIAILADVLPSLAPPDVRRTAYLLSGKIGPSFASPEFGMAGKMIARAMAEAFEVPLARIDALAVRSGDLGAVAERLAPARRARLSIADVFSALSEIAHLSGPGTQRAKIERLATLLRAATGVEAKYVVRTVAGTHRIGAAEMTFLHGLAKAFGSSPRDAAALEYAYNVLSDLGEVAFRVARGGTRALRRIAPKPGIPVRMMLAGRVEELGDVTDHIAGTLFVEYKYDGERAQVHKQADGTMRIFSRRLEDITHQYPEVIEHVRKALRARSAIVEGEVVAIDPKTRHLLPFQHLMQRKRKRDVARYRANVPVALFLFDALFLDGKSLLEKPLSERKRLLERHLTPDPTAGIGTFILTDSIARAERYFHEALAHGAEGVVIKDAASPYQAGHRGWHWIKFKKEYQRELTDTFDVVVVGASYGKGTRAGTYGSLLVAAFDPRTNKYYSFTKVGTGFSDALLRSLPKTLKPYRIPECHRLVETGMKMDVWFEPAVVLEISGADLTISPVHTVARATLKRGGIALRFPRLLRMRDDKTAEEATTTGEILAMYRQRARSARAAIPA